MDKLPLAMVREDFEGLPSCPLPSGYHLRNFRRGEDRTWAEVQAAAGLFESVEKALEGFAKEFAEHPDEMESRSFFLVHDETERVIGSTTAWYDTEYQGGGYGRIHWVAIIPEFQGKGLAKPLLARAMRRLADLHSSALLWTNTGCVKAVRMYLDFGFKPLPISERWEEAWRMMANELKHPALCRCCGNGE